MTTILIILLVLAFISGAPLFSILLGASALGTAVSTRGFTVGFDAGIGKMISMGTGDQGEALATIPMFIYAGYLLAEAKTADRLVRFANALMGWVPGGLAIVTIGTCALFTVFTGASGVTIIALGGVLMPALVRNGYPERFSMGLIAGTGSVGLLFPPALPLFIYGAIAGLNIQKEWTMPGCVQHLANGVTDTSHCWPTWDTQRFLFAGVVPGLVLVGMLSAVAVFVAVRKKLPVQKFNAGELGKSFLKALPELFIPFGVIGGMASGFGLSEIAALTVIYVVLLEVVALKMLKIKALWDTCREALAMVGAIFIIIFCATAFTDYLVNANVPDKLVAWTQDHVSSKIVFLLALNLILLLVGTVMDIFSAIVVVLPLVLGVAHSYGIDPYHLGVIFLLNLEVGYLHPPVGLNLFITSVKFQRPITEVMWATIPFLITMLVALVTITYVPQLTVVPEEEPIGKISSLVEIVHTAAEEQRALKEVGLVAVDGTPLVDDAGKPIVLKVEDCEKRADDKDKASCKAVFFYSDECKSDAKPDECTHKKIAGYAKRNSGLILQKEVALVDDDKKPVVDKSGAPVIKKIEDCDKETDQDKKDNCHGLFVDVSGCKIDPEGASFESCVFDVVSKWVRDNPP